MKDDGVGYVETQKFDIKGTIELESGKTLDNVTVAYETYGKLNKNKTNAILICHALTGDAHAAGWHKNAKKPGWWDIIIGPGKALDTNKFFVICSNVLGGCKGTTGPASINPETGEEYGMDFPVITIKDMVNVQKVLVIECFKINQLTAVIGGSMGGMQVLQWMISYPDIVKKAIPIATTGRSTPQQIAFNAVGRQAIFSDPKWNQGEYYKTNDVPKSGLSVARMMAHITYLSEESMDLKFGRSLQDKNEKSFDFEIDFQVESYLKHQGTTFVERFDANSYLYITKAVDYFDLSEEGSLIEGLSNVKSKVKIIAVDTDWLYPVEQNESLVNALAANDVNVSYSELQSPHGHDAFLLEEGQLNFIISSFLSENIVADLMKTDVPTLNTNSGVREAAELMVKEQVTHVPIVNGVNELMGIVTSWDLSKAIANDTYELDKIMTKSVQSCSKEDSIIDIAKKLKDYDISCLPVIGEDKKLEGLITSELISHLISKY